VAVSLISHLFRSLFLLACAAPSLQLRLPCVSQSLQLFVFVELLEQLVFRLFREQAVRARSTASNHAQFSFLWPYELSYLSKLLPAIFYQFWLTFVEVTLALRVRFARDHVRFSRG
jgi:hypothetical protein